MKLDHYREVGDDPAPSFGRVQFDFDACMILSLLSIANQIADPFAWHSICRRSGRKRKRLRGSVAKRQWRMGASGAQE